MQHCDAFDYWGKGTEVTVSSDTSVPPTLFPLTPCALGSGDNITLGCLAQGFFPRSVTFQWTSTSNTEVDSDQFIFLQNKDSNNRFTGVSVIHVSRSTALSYKCSLTHPTGNKSVQVEFSPPNVRLLSVPDGEKQVLICSIEDFAPRKMSVSWEKNTNNVSGFSSFDPIRTGGLNSAVSILKVDKTEWDSKAVYTCGVNHQGQKYMKKASKVPVTVTLNPPSPNVWFANKRAEVKCVVSGQDTSVLANTQIIWSINGQQVKNNISETSESQKKTSTLTRSFAEWNTVNIVSCSAERETMTPITQSFTITRGQKEPNIQVLIPSENPTDNEVTLVCLVTSPVLQDYYITWQENSEPFRDGLILPPQKMNNSYVVSSFYTITKDKWQRQNTFSCNVWPAGSDKHMKPRSVSGFRDLNVTTNALSCMDNVSEGDDFNSLWSTTSSFIFLFIFSLSYNMLFSLVQMKKQ